MGHHLTEDNKFKSDKYKWCPEGYFALKFTDPDARQCIAFYSVLTQDKELADDLIEALKNTEDADSS